jgi:cation transport ATPase
VPPPLNKVRRFRPGALSDETAFTIRAEKLSADSRYARVMRVMEETREKRMRRIALESAVGGMVLS